MTLEKELQEVGKDYYGKLIYFLKSKEFSVNVLNKMNEKVKELLEDKDAMHDHFTLTSMKLGFEMNPNSFKPDIFIEEARFENGFTISKYSEKVTSSKRHFMLNPFYQFLTPHLILEALNEQLQSIELYDFYLYRNNNTFSANPSDLDIS